MQTDPDPMGQCCTPRSQPGALFDRHVGGMSEAAWQDSPLTSMPRLEVPGSGAHVLVVAAHPDDETLGAGGLIAASSARGATVEVLVATDGEASHPTSPTYSPTQLAPIRRREVSAALAALAPGVKPVFLGLPDGELHEHRRRLVEEIERRLAGCSHVVSPWRADRHPDHEACAHAVFEATLKLQNLGVCESLQFWQYPIWAWHWGDPLGPDLPWDHLWQLALDTAQVTAKRTALGSYRSQHTALSPAPGDEPVLEAGFLTHFTREFEVFVVEPGSPAGRAEYFDRLYETTPDPWGLADRYYERRKRDLLLASLPRPHFRRVFEPGCATGLLTARLIPLCDEVIAWDGAQRAVTQTRARVAGAEGVLVEQRRIPDDWPPGEFDLIVLSEVGYYCADLKKLAARVDDSMPEDGVVLACHWRHEAEDHPHRAQDVHDAIAATGLRRIVHHDEADFLLDVWSPSGESVAMADGVLS